MDRRRRLAGATAVALAVAAAGRALAVRRRGSAWPRAAGADPRPARWQVVTVDRPPGEVLPGGRWPEPLRRLGGAVQVELRPAPGCRGTELAARPVPGAAAPAGLAAHLVGDDPGLLVRRALWEVKQLAETGEVLRADRWPADRPPGPPR
ncbi:hypothetical protein ACLQ20_16645 [Micromonospora sp. DT46]|uniref:hypothetical protein n=1 Tax=unclassified Micromonospora TaxID=2617518 RepID=UPI00124B93E1|nr:MULTISPECIES: hypothetical protein [unclassified Micromonospora]KAB1128851.1 hypothetical protein F6X68_30065 [Micromonospora sp. AMSO12t]WSG01998.1 hypothetical protein OG989_30925 [Micromonospora sp. NBC_01740]